MNPSPGNQNQLPQRYRQRPRPQTWYAPVPGTTQHVYNERPEDLQIPSSTIAVVPPQGLQSPTRPVQLQLVARPYTRAAIAMAPTRHRRQSYMSNASSGNSSMHATPHSYGWSGGVQSDPMSIIGEHRLDPRTNARAGAMEMNAAGESRYFHVPPTQGFGRPVRQADPSLLTPENPDTKRKSHLLREARQNQMELRPSTQRYSSASSRTESSLNDRQSLPSQRARASTSPGVFQGYPVRRSAIRVAKSASSGSSRNDVSHPSVSRHRRTTSKDSATQTEDRPEQGPLDIHNNQTEIPRVFNKSTALKHRSESREASQPAQNLYRSSKPRKTSQANIGKKVVKWASHSSYAPSVHYRTDSEGSASSGLIEIPDSPSSTEGPKGIPRLRLLFEDDEDEQINEEIDLDCAIVDPIDQEIAKASNNAIKHRRQGAVGVEVKRRASRMSPPMVSMRSHTHYPTDIEAGGLLGAQYSFPPSHSSRKGVHQDMNYGFRFPHHEGDVSDLHSSATSAPHPPHSDPSFEAATAFGKKYGHRRGKAPYDSKSSLPPQPTATLYHEMRQRITHYPVAQRTNVHMTDSAPHRVPIGHNSTTVENADISGHLEPCHMDTYYETAL